MKIWFTDFWNDFYTYNLFIDIFNEYGLPYTLDSKNPELLFFSHFGMNHLTYSCPKILVSSECSKSEWTNTHFSAQFFHNNVAKEITHPTHIIGTETIIHPNYLRIPIYIYHLHYIKVNKIPSYFTLHKKKFCSMVYRHAGTDNIRERICTSLSKYKPVEIALNPFTRKIETAIKIPLNPKPTDVESKWDFISNYKFDLAIEHMIQDGLITEKIVDAMLCGNIPIYHGTPTVGNDFPNSYLIKYDENQSFDQIKKVDTDDVFRYDMATNNKNSLNGILEAYIPKIFHFCQSLML